MKQKRQAMIMVGLFLCSSLVLAQAYTAMAEELRPSQKIMQARAGWMKAMGENLTAMNYDSVKKDAEALAGQLDGHYRITGDAGGTLVEVDFRTSVPH